MVSFSKLVEQATSETLLETNWALNLELTDMIRQGDVTGKECIKQMKKRMFNRNPNVVLHTLTLLETLVKNCGGPVQSEIATKDFMDQYRRLGSNRSIKEKLLEMIQNWAHAFQNQPKYKIVPDTFNILRVEGFDFPEYNAQSDAMFTAEVAPEWADSRDCYGCRVRFTLTNRKHHCRMCGQIFCQKCSSKNSPIPKFGIEKHVRVCNYCHDEINGITPATPAAASDTTQGTMAAAPAVTQEQYAQMSEYERMQYQASQNANLSPEEQVALMIEQEKTLNAPAPVSTGAGGSEQQRREQELKEQEEMELAMALSMSEAETQQQRHSSAATSAYNQASAPGPSPLHTPAQTKSGGLYGAHFDALDSVVSADTAGAGRVGQRGAGATPALSAAAGQSGTGAPPTTSGDLIVPLAAPEDITFLSSLRSGIQLFEQKLMRAHKRGGGVASDMSLQAIFRSLSLMHPELLSRIDALEDERSTFEALREKQEKIRATWAHMEEVKREQIKRAAQQKAEQDALERLQVEQKMKLIAQQEAEKRQHQLYMEEQLRQQEEEARVQQEEAELVRQQAAFQKQQQLLAEQQQALEERRRAQRQQQVPQQAWPQHTAHPSSQLHHQSPHSPHAQMHAPMGRYMPPHSSAMHPPPPQQQYVPAPPPHSASGLYQPAHPPATSGYAPPSVGYHAAPQPQGTSWHAGGQQAQAHPHAQHGAPPQPPLQQSPPPGLPAPLISFD